MLCGTCSVAEAMPQNASRHTQRTFVFAQVCNHPGLSYPQLFGWGGDRLAATCGKLMVLDRMLVKLHASGHRVLLFSTMTKLLDLLQVPHPVFCMPEILLRAAPQTKRQQSRFTTMRVQLLTGLLAQMP